ncbi:DUF429 domain-containing protein [Sporotomaculum syntrophicum]|uniref:DUF429 domain-containing protein n=1 Tax=Sporotomaculum syntrophicum TaxID=182264 RepID=UPI00137A2960|nr:DUF429 domain-containing protein [Sporotomaculum syntrophicum]
MIDEQSNILGNCIVKTDDEILEYVLGQDDEDGIIVGIDAPLIIPTWVTKQRPCEIVMGKLDLPAYPANRNLFNQQYNGVRGEHLVSLFESKIPGMHFVDSLNPRMPVRAIMEIYPYATLKYLYWEISRQGLLTLKEFKTEFNKIKVPKYKGCKVNKDKRINGLEHNIQLIRRFIKLRDGIVFSPTLTTENFNVLHPDLNIGMTVNELEQVSDYLDSAAAAYTVWRYWLYGDAQSIVVGNKNDGYILIPADEHIKARLTTIINTVSLCNVTKK